MDVRITITHGRFDENDDEGHYSASSIGYAAIFDENCDVSELHLSGIYGEETPLSALKINDIKIKKLVISHCKLTSEFSFLLDIDYLELNTTIFTQIVSFSGSKIKEIKCKNVTFYRAVAFNKCEFGTVDTKKEKKILFDYVEFMGFTNFRDTSFYVELDIINTKFHNQPNFLNSTFFGKSQLNTNRENFRIIKHSFQAVGNQIEENRFFEYEMYAYQHELKESTGKGARRERALLTLNGWISDHGQNYVKAMCWWFVVVGFTALVLENQFIQKLLHSYSGPVVWQVVRDLLNGLAKGALPLSAAYKNYKGFEFFILIVTLFLSGITWHFLVSLRRHSKKN